MKSLTNDITFIWSYYQMHTFWAPYGLDAQVWSDEQITLEELLGVYVKYGKHHGGQRIVGLVRHERDIRSWEQSP